MSSLKKYQPVCQQCEEPMIILTRPEHKVEPAYCPFCANPLFQRNIDEEDAD